MKLAEKAESENFSNSDLFTEELQSIETRALEAARRKVLSEIGTIHASRDALGRALEAYGIERITNEERRF